MTTVEPGERQRIEAACLATVLSTVDRGILLEDRYRRVLAVNPPLGELFGVVLDTERLAGTRLAEHLPAAGEDPGSWARLTRAVRDARENTVPLQLPGGRTLERRYAPVTVDGNRYGHVWVFRDVTDAGLIQRALDEHGRHLAEFSALKSRFISVVSHELRTPLTSIATFVEMLNSDTEPNLDELPGALAAIQRNTDRMLTLLGDLALLSRLESGEVPEGDVPQLLDPVPLVDSAAAMLRALAPGLTVHLYTAPGPPLHGDRQLLRELLQTMAGASAACAVGGDAYVTARADSAEWTISMSVTEAQDVTNELLLGTRLPDADAGAPPRSVALAMLLARAIASNQGGMLTTSSEAPDNLTLLLRLPVPA
ncbi:MAG TPA: histidine kinase dimerization/phospho-acceptor domain-containing protein [Rugosimonospora sp.]|nr:histidine kinase dimerization/phospho-acceptor domain-containing protein [Rugosimonospora sp.]